MGWTIFSIRATIRRDPAYVLDSFIRVKLKQIFD